MRRCRTCIAIRAATRVSAAITACALATLSPAVFAQESATVILVDCTGAPTRAGAVRIIGGRIAEVGDVAITSRDRVVDARGLVLAPGFIDTHSH
jgi:N-acyl-D-amino-acid deacylase